MKKNCKTMLLVGFCALVSLSSCNKTNEKDSKETTKTVVKDTVKKLDNKVNLLEYDPIVQQLMVTDAGDLRGLNFGDSISTIKKKEIGKLQKNDSNDSLRIYMVQLTGSNENDVADARYFLDKNQLIKQFELDIFANIEGQVIDVFKKYFNAKYGEMSGVRDGKDSKDSIFYWKSKRDYKITMFKKKRKDENDAPGVVIRMK